MNHYQIVPVGDQALEIVFANEINPQVNQQIHHLGQLILNAQLPAVQTVVPAYHTLTVLFDGSRTSCDDLKPQLQPLVERALQAKSLPSKTWLIPVCYGGEFGPDLAKLADFAHVDEAQAIKLHTGRDYLIYFLGFLPGFAYMASVVDQIAMPRLAKPRLKIAARSVGIAGKQTGFYPVESPGGWEIIGRTPVTLYRPDHPQSFYAAGDKVRFVSINQDEYRQIRQADQAGTYQVKAVINDGND
ncbi:5-oxoprolinase subunit PxpB [Limosilactobacillus sp.]|uniref:5-oxoprolinase subunit PxpB n=1 Tax=Limosilactobacillus sp. TaxID=2773925 RepID=UPI00345E31C3